MASNTDNKSFDIKRVAKLANIKIDEQDQDLTKQLEKTIEWINQLAEVNTDNVKELNNVNNIFLEFNQDKVLDGNIAEDIMQNNQKRIIDFFVVPKVIE